MEALGILALCALGIYAMKKYEEKKQKDQEEAAKPLISPHDLPTCYGYINSLLVESHKGEAWWRIRKADPQEGRIIGIIQWEEFIGDQIGNMKRQIILTVDFEPMEESSTAIYTHWDVVSPMHRGEVNEVMNGMKKAIKRELSAEVAS